MRKYFAAILVALLCGLVIAGEFPPVPNPPKVAALGPNDFVYGLQNGANVRIFPVSLFGGGGGGPFVEWTDFNETQINWWEDPDRISIVDGVHLTNVLIRGSAAPVPITRWEGEFGAEVAQMDFRGKLTVRSIQIGDGSLVFTNNGDHSTIYESDVPLAKTYTDRWLFLTNVVLNPLTMIYGNGAGLTNLTMSGFTNAGNLAYSNAETAMVNLGTNAILLQSTGQGLADTNWVLQQIGTLANHVYLSGVTNSGALAGRTNNWQGFSSPVATTTTNQIDSLADGTYVYHGVSTNTLTRLGDGPVSIRLYAFKGAAGTLTLHPEFYLYDTVTDSLIEVLAPAAKAIATGAPVLYEWTGLAASTNLANPCKLVVSIKIDSAAGSPSVYIVRGGAYDSSMTYVQNIASSTIQASQIVGLTNQWPVSAITNAGNLAYSNAATARVNFATNATSADTAANASTAAYANSADANGIDFGDTTPADGYLVVRNSGGTGINNPSTSFGTTDSKQTLVAPSIRSSTNESLTMMLVGGEVAYATNNAASTVRFSKAYSEMGTNNTVNFVFAGDRSTTKYQTCVIMVTNSSGSLKTINQPANTRTNGILNVTNVTACTFFNCAGRWTNLVAMPLW